MKSISAIFLTVTFAINCHCSRDICYGYLGCFTRIKTSLFLQEFQKLPKSPETINTRFYLFTQKSSKVPFLIDYNETHVNYPASDKPDKLFFQFHGFGDDLNDTNKSFQPMREMLLHINPKASVIFVDTSQGTAQTFDIADSYFQAVANIQVSGRVTAVFLKILLKMLNIPASSCHFIGHSLGAHTAAYAGQWYKNITHGDLIARITGLDPAGAVFESASNPNDTLSKDDATYVDVIHTAAGYLLEQLFTGPGIVKQVGHSDTYVNGGHRQPGCEFTIANICGHVRAIDLFTSSVNNSCPFTAYHCKGYDTIFLKPLLCQTSCISEPCGQMGYYSDPVTSYGVMAITTTGSSPFC